MIRYYYSTGDKKLEQLDSYESGAWIYVEDPTEAEVNYLVDTFELDQGLITDALDEDEMPRLERAEKHLAMFTRFAFTTRRLHIETDPIMFALSDKTLITVSSRTIPRLERFTGGQIAIDTTRPTRALLQILDQIVDEYEIKLNTISRQIKAIRSRLRVEKIHNKDFIDFVGIEDMLNEFLSALSPTNAILRRLLLGKHMELSEDDENLVQDLLLNNEQSIEACKSNLKTIVNIREAYSTIMSNNLNRVIRLLTVLTVVLSVPTLISSIYGMNVPLPFESARLAFSGIMAISLTISVVLLVIFKRNDWL